MYTDWKKEIKVFVIADGMVVCMENPKELTIMTTKLLEVKSDSGKVTGCEVHTLKVNFFPTCQPWVNGILN